jgi:chemotaxis protein methyltransferase CheR
VLQRAERGEYSQLEVNRGLPVQFLVKYFQRSGLGWQVKPEVRRMVKFLRVNLIEPWPALAAQDIVFMRNVLIYFTPQTKRLLLGKLRELLTADGALFLGGAETTIGIDDAWQRVNHGKTSLYRLSRT